MQRLRPAMRPRGGMRRGSDACPTSQSGLGNAHLVTEACSRNAARCPTRSSTSSRMTPSRTLVCGRAGPCRVLRRRRSVSLESPMADRSSQATDNQIRSARAGKRGYVAADRVASDGEAACVQSLAALCSVIYCATDRLPCPSRTLSGPSRTCFASTARPDRRCTPSTRSST